MQFLLWKSIQCMASRTAIPKLILGSSDLLLSSQLYWQSATTPMHSWSNGTWIDDASYSFLHVALDSFDWQWIMVLFVTLRILATASTGQAQMSVTANQVSPASICNLKLHGPQHFISRTAMIVTRLAQCFYRGICSGWSLGGCLHTVTVQQCRGTSLFLMGRGWLLSQLVWRRRCPFTCRWRGSAARLCHSVNYTCE